MDSQGHRLQLLYDACKQTFTSRDISTTDNRWTSLESLRAVKSIVDTITLSDLGLTEEIIAQEDQDYGFYKVLTGWREARSSMVAWWSPPITYRHIYECKGFSIGIFVLPKSAIIPLHNHPGMTVLSKLLYGSMHIKSYDWVEPTVQMPETGTPRVRLAKLAMDKVFMAPCDSTVLYPNSGGNIHAIKAVTPCALLDVLSPPYSDEEGRSITYYRSYPCSTYHGPRSGSLKCKPSKHTHTWLAEFPLIDDVVKRVPYEAPKILE